MTKQTFIFLLLIMQPGGHSSWTITPMPNTDVCMKMLKAVEARGGRGGGENKGECIEIKTSEPLNDAMETLKGGRQ
ncbi:hypothetical protein [Klebsiella michiganensis]|uniref:hypothetical protein n=1 Tax=Klebsiella michiganensis TaxID=1134687 RepID=UPI0013D0529A|nr:hypothetical protein [Klebsiella michiganensis]